METTESEGWPDQIDWDLCLRTLKVITQWEKNWLGMRMVSVRTQTVKKDWFRFRTVCSLKNWQHHSMGNHIHWKLQTINNVSTSLDFSWILHTFAENDQQWSKVLGTLPTIFSKFLHKIPFNLRQLIWHQEKLAEMFNRHPLFVLFYRTCLN